METVQGEVFFSPDSEEQRKREDKVRKEARGKAVVDRKLNAELTFNLYDNKGEMLRDKDSGYPVLLTASGRAIIVRFRKDAPVAFTEDAREIWDTEAENLKRLKAARKLIKHASTNGKPINMVKVDDSDNFLVLGYAETIMIWLKLARKDGLIESVEEQQNMRVPVVSQGSADNAACQRRAYKDMIRKTPKIIRLCKNQRLTL